MGFAVGDQIATVIGEPVTIMAIEPLDGKREVFNLTIAEDHSYAIGELGVWGHNAKYPKKKGKRGRSPSYYCKNVDCGAPHGGGISDLVALFCICDNCASKNREGLPILLENGQRIPPFTIKD